MIGGHVHGQVRDPLARTLQRWHALSTQAQDVCAAAGLAVLSLAVIVAEPVKGDLNKVTRPIDALGVALALAATLPFALRRRHPVAILPVLFTATVVAVSMGYAGGLLGLWFFLALGSAVVHSRRPIALPIAILGTAVALGATPALTDGELTPISVLGIAILGGVPAMVGYALRTQRALNAELAEQAAGAMKLRTSELHRAVAEERMQIARDVHDIVGHHLSAIHLQAGGGRRVAIRSGGGSAAETFGVIEALSSHALDEIRRTLGMLRHATADLMPVPDLGDLDALLASFRGAGVDVELDVQGAEREIAPAVATCAYRIVQEALTNVAKHARPPRALLRIAYDTDELRLLVQDFGVPEAHDGRDDGHGLLGMRERAELLGGRFDAGRNTDGWRVTAVLPVGGSS